MCLISFGTIAYKMGGRTDQIVDIVDLAPTIFHLAGIKQPVHMHGQNIFSTGRKK